MVQLVEWVRVELYRGLNDTCGLSSLVLGVDGFEQGNGLRAVLPLTRHQCNIHCESSLVAHGSSKWRWAPQTTRNQTCEQGWRMAPLENFSPPWKNVLTKFENIGHSSKILGPLENSSPLLVSQAGYGPTHILEIGKFMHRLHWGRIPVNFDQLFTPVNQAHSHATRAATRGGYIWQTFGSWCRKLVTGLLATLRKEYKTEYKRNSNLFVLLRNYDATFKTCKTFKKWPIS